MNVSRIQRSDWFESKCESLLELNEPTGHKDNQNLIERIECQ